MPADLPLGVGIVDVILYRKKGDGRPAAAAGLAAGTGEGCCATAVPPARTIGNSTR
jgi:hypothetical protein